MAAEFADRKREEENRRVPPIGLDFRPPAG
jgi:hypothetical protein